MLSFTLAASSAHDDGEEMWARRCELFQQKAALFQLSRWGICGHVVNFALLILMRIFFLFNVSSPAVILPPPYLFSHKAFKCPSLSMLPSIVHWSWALYPGVPRPNHARDCFDPEQHQSLDFLYSSWVINANKPCKAPQVRGEELSGNGETRTLVC